MSPLVSVVMPVRNGRPFLDAAIESILNQSFSDFQFIIFDDASSDGTWERLEWWASKDARVRLERSLRHLGPALSSQRVSSLAQAPWIARQDADDVSLPDRLQRQVAVARCYPEAALIGTLFATIDEQDRLVRPRDRARLLGPSQLNPFPHGSVMMSTSVFLRSGGYRPECAYWEDQDLFMRMARLGRVLVLTENYYLVRVHRGSGRSSVPPRQMMEICASCNQVLNQRYHGIEANGPARVDSRAIYGALLHRFWLGARPEMLHSLISMRAFPRTLSELLIWIFALLAEIHPGWLRTGLFRWLQYQDHRASRKLAPFEAVELSYPWGKQPPVGRRISL